MLFGNAQSKKLRRANFNFKEKNFFKAIHQYNNLIDNGDKTVEIYQNLADSYYLNANYIEASKWYTQLVNNYPESLDNEHIYRYASSLRAEGNHKASFALLQKLNISSSKNKPINQYLNEIKERYGSYTVNTIDINSAASDFAPSFRLDGIVFSTGRDTSGIVKSIHNWNKKRFLNLYMATHTEGNRFKKIMRFSDRLNTKLHESSTAFTKDGNTVYFTRNKEKGKDFGRDKDGYSRLKLYKSVFSNNQWSEPKELDFNKEGYSVAHPTLNKTEDKLYFVADLPGSVGQSDIFVVEILSNGNFGEPKNLGLNINTLGRETFPFVSDNNILYFASDGHPGLGGLDIFAVDLNNLNSSNIVNLGQPINSTTDDFSFIINSNTKKGYFASNRKGGKGDDDIYALTEVKEIDTRCFTTISGIVKNKVTDKPIPNSTISLINIDGSLLAETTSDATGFFILDKECKKNNFKVTASKDTYKSFEKIIDLQKNKIDLDNLNILLSKINEKALVGEELTKHLSINPIYFDLNKSNIREEGKIILKKIIAYMQEYPEAIIEVRSHTDSRGNNKYNKTLSDKRARETVNFIISNGISSERISGKGYGETQLSNECNNSVYCTDAKHQENRKSEFIVIK